MNMPGTLLAELRTKLEIMGLLKKSGESDTINERATGDPSASSDDDEITVDGELEKSEENLQGMGIIKYINDRMREYNFARETEEVSDSSGESVASQKEDELLSGILNSKLRHVNNTAVEKAEKMLISKGFADHSDPDQETTEDSPEPINKHWNAPPIEKTEPETSESEGPEITFFQLRILEALNAMKIPSSFITINESDELREPDDSTEGTESTSWEYQNGSPESTKESRNYDVVPTTTKQIFADSRSKRILTM